MAAKFKYGDRVIVGGNKGKVVSVFKTNSNYSCKVRFDNQNLIPPEMEYDESLLVFEQDHSDRCPICNTKWNITKFNHNTWKDCLKCNKKSEDILKECAENQGSKKKSPSFNINGKNRDEMMEELELILNSFGDMDDDDFGFLD
jgi:hypothetical protein